MATSLGTTVTGGAANTKGSYAQLTASTSADASCFLVMLSRTTNNSWVNSVDIAIGAGGSETIIAPDLICTFGSSVFQAAFYWIPCSIPAGTRIAARSQGDSGSEAIQVSVILFDGDFSGSGYAGVDAIGFLSASTTGTVIDSGGTANTKGGYTQLIASTARDYCGLLISTDPDQTTPAGNAKMFLDIAIGAAGSENVIIPNFVQSLAAQDCPSCGIGPFFINIPSGTRIAAQAQSSSNILSQRRVGLTLYGIYK